MGLTADQATRMTPLLLAGVILAGGFAVLAHLAPGRTIATPEVEPVGVASSEEGVDIDAAWPEADWLALSDSLRALNHNLPPEEGGETPTDPTGSGQASEDETGEDGPPPIITGDFKFLGAIVQGDSSAALIEVNGRQRFVRVDEEIANHTIKSIHDDHIIVETKGKEGRISIADPGRSGLNAVERFQRDNRRAAESLRERAARNRDLPPEALNPDRER